MAALTIVPKRSWNVFDAGEIDELKSVMDRFGVEAEKTINDVLHKEGAQEIKKDITHLLPASGRNWKGKGASARAAMPGRFAQDDDLLAVTIAARGKYHYLYFPDDGSNTRKHVGNQRFMKKGAEKATSKIIDLCLGKLIT